jgi:hypothetical protein
MNPFEKLLKGYYTQTFTRESLPPVGAPCRPRKKRKTSTATRKPPTLGKAITRYSSLRNSETFTRESLGPPDTGTTNSKEGPA